MRLAQWICSGTLILLELSLMLAKIFSPPSTYNLLQRERLAKALAESEVRRRAAERTDREDRRPRLVPPLDGTS